MNSPPCIACLHFLISTKHKVQQRLTAMSLFLQAFSHQWNEILTRWWHKMKGRGIRIITIQPNFTAIYQIVVMLMVALEGKTENDQSWLGTSSGHHGYLYQILCQFIKSLEFIYPLGTMNMCTKFHGNPSNTWDSSVWTKLVTDRRTDNQALQSLNVFL